ncbi:hypothetical protein Lal_00034364 [Lupinus albus]|uniref:Putative transcription factor MYB-HB-like family n=1 Tax=Lupinus albus TaxID=3870 RepID=A0A6A4QV32_LUPAL|nr:putative transcription factor MYB-HB-like family [Lupinus albus]KAF1896665.1 hypothetical protein Lal_00034364 [Lupinus albus]
MLFSDFPRKSRSKREKTSSLNNFNVMEREREREFDRSYIKKGPWSVEEDEVLLSHVNKYGPRDWSSIRTKALLHRTGKSCRLRWVNKLRPNLKSGCKFSIEEEMLVIELQAEFGNKWAKIATYLEGRTDNDVKNFWSSRRKRLERMLKKPSPSKPEKSKGKSPLYHVQVEEVPACSSNQVEERPCFTYNSYPASYIDKTKEIKMVHLPDLTKPNYQNHYLDSDLNAMEVKDTPFDMVPATSFASSSGYNFPQLPEPQMDYPLFPGCHDLAPVPFDPNFIDIFELKSCPESVCSQKLVTRLPTLGIEGSCQNTIPSGFFEEFPTEMLECFEHLPTSSEQKTVYF